MAAYSALLSRATNVSNTPFTPYTGQETAPVNEQQLMGVGSTNMAAMGFAPYAGNAGSYISAAGTPVSPSDISQYMDQYTSSVINATQADFDTQNARAKSVTDSGAAAQGALGGNRVGVAEALTQEGQERVQAPVMAQLRSQGFQNAEQMANQQKARQLQSGQVLSGADLAAAQQQFAFGTQQQQTTQAQDTQQMTDYYTAQGYPFATAQWLAGITLGTGAQMGQSSTGQSTTEGPQPNTFAQVAGAGLSALSMFSDKRLKENIKEVGRLHDGQKIYRYNFKGDPTTHVGLISQEVEKKHPHAVSKVAGFGAVDYDKATEDAIKKWSGGAISGFADGGTPYGPGTQGWVPTIGKIGGSTLHDPGVQAPKMGEQKQPDYSGMGKSLGTIGKGLSDWYNDPMTQSAPAEWGGFDSTENQGFGASADIGGLGYERGGAVRKGFEDGGVPTLDDRFSAMDDTSTPVSLGFTGALEPSYEKRFGAGVPIKLPESKGFEPVQGDPTGVEDKVPVPTPRPASADAGVAPAAPEPEPTAYEKPTGGYADRMERIAAAHKKIESNGNYFSVGQPDPNTGDRPWGAYQVMGKNVGPWTEQYLGRRMTPQEFLKNPEAQDAVYKARMGGYIEKYGLQGALDHWLGMGKQDYLGTSHPEYQRRFAAAFNGDTGGGGDRGGSSNPDVMQASYRGFAPESTGVPRGQPPFIPGVSAPPEQKARTGMGGFNPLGLSDEARQGLISMGLGMMANRRGGKGSFLASVGEGGEQGMTTYASARAATQGQEALTRKEALERERMMLPYSNMTANEKFNAQLNIAKAQEATRAHNMAMKTPVPYYSDEDGVKHFAIPRPSPSGEVDFYPIDKNGNISKSPLGGSLKEAAQANAPPELSQPEVPPQLSSGPKLQQAGYNPDEGIIRTASKMEDSGQTFDYAKNTPIVDKGTPVPRPSPIAGHSTQSIEADAEKYIQTGALPPTRSGQSPTAIAQQKYRTAVQNYGVAKAASMGMDEKDLTMAQRTAPGMLRFLMNPQTGGTTVALGTAIRHLDTLEELARVWHSQAGSGDFVTKNRILGSLRREFGNDAITSLESAASIVGPEIIKAIGVAGGGTAEDRTAAEKRFGPYLAPGQLYGNVKTVEKLLAGQLEGKERQATSVGVSHEQFKNLIGDRPYTLLKGLLDAEKGGGSAAKSEMSDQDQAALKWANANPKDPRAEAIKKKLGVQ